MLRIILVIKYIKIKKLNSHFNYAQNYIILVIKYIKNQEAHFWERNMYFLRKGTTECISEQNSMFLMEKNCMRVKKIP